MVGGVDQGMITVECMEQGVRLQLCVMVDISAGCEVQM